MSAANLVTNLVTASIVADVHDWFSWAVIFSNALVALWALAAHRRPSLRSIGLWVGPHAQGVCEKVGHRHRAVLIVDGPLPMDALQANRVAAVGHRQLGGVLDDHHAFGRRHRRQEAGQQGRLAGPRGAGHKHVQARPHRGRQERRHWWTQPARRDPVRGRHTCVRIRRYFRPLGSQRQPHAPVLAD